MFCIICGKKLPDDAQFCYFCGNPVFNETSDNIVKDNDQDSSDNIVEDNNQGSSNKKASSLVEDCVESKVDDSKDSIVDDSNNINNKAVEGDVKPLKTNTVQTESTTTMDDNPIWYYLSSSKERKGPFSEKQIEELVNKGKINAKTKVHRHDWDEGPDGWIGIGNSALRDHIKELRDLSKLPVERRVSDFILWIWAAVPLVALLLATIISSQYISSALIAGLFNIVLLICDYLYLKRNGVYVENWLWTGLIIAPLYIFGRIYQTTKKYAPGIAWVISTVVAIIVSVTLASSSQGMNYNKNDLSQKMGESSFTDGLFIAELKGNAQPDGVYNNSCSIYRIDMGSGKSTKVSYFEALDEGYDCYYWGLGSIYGHDTSYQRASIIFKDGGSKHVGWIDTKGNITDVSKLYIGEKQNDFYGNVTHGCPKFDRNGYFYFEDVTNHVVVKVLVDGIEHNNFEVIAEDVSNGFQLRNDGTVHSGDYNHNATGEKDIGNSDIWLTDDEYICDTDGFPVCIADKPGNYGAKNVQYSLIPSVQGRVNRCPTLSPDHNEIAFLSYVNGEDIVDLYTIPIAPNQTPNKINIDMEMKHFDNDKSHTSYTISEWRGSNNAMERVDIENKDINSNGEVSDNSDGGNSKLFSDDKTEQSNKTENPEGYYSVIEDKMGSLPPSVFEEIYGHYVDEFQDTVDINSTDSMERFVRGGHEDHTYDEKICGYKVLDKGYLIKVEWGGVKYTYLYSKNNGEECLYLSSQDGWDPSLEPYAYNDIQNYIKTGVANDNNSKLSDTDSDESSSEPDINASKYNIGIMELKKEGNYYYVYPGDTTALSEDGYEMLYIPSKIKISKNAKLGMATEVHEIIDYDDDIGRLQYSYKYYDFYDEADRLISNGRWFYDNSYGYNHMDFLNPIGNATELCPLVHFNENGDIDVFLEYYES